MKQFYRELALKVLFGAMLLGFVVQGLALLAIAYYALSGQWLPAIFILLARKDVVKWLDEKMDNVIKAVKENT